MRYVFLSENEHQVQQRVGKLCVPVGQKIYAAALSHEIEPLLARGSIPQTTEHTKTPAEPEPDGGAAYDRASAAESFSADTEK